MFTHYFRFARRSMASPRRAPLLERLLARADSSTAVSDWRADAFRVIAPTTAVLPGVGAVALYAEFGALHGAAVIVATPVRYLAEMSNVRLTADGILTLRQGDADLLAADFNRVWHDAGIRMVAGRRAELFCIADQPLNVSTHDPKDVLAQHIEKFLPVGEDARRLRQLMSEIEMWLFEHAVNRARVAAGAAAINALWLWGVGPVLKSLPPVIGWVAGDDLFFNAFAGPRDSTAAVAGVVTSGAEPGTDAWREVESEWIEGSLAALRSGQIGRLDLSAGSRCFSLSSGAMRRFWRRGRPWWESFA
ncbi:MAG: hypothetical protein ABJD53_14355 [Gammaproteobacteria bacterium]